MADVEDIEDAVNTEVRRSHKENGADGIRPKTESKRKTQQRKEAVGYDIPGTQTVFLKTFGCSHNSSDSEYMAGQLVEYGYGITEDFDAADVFVINSCTVKNPSEAHFHTIVNKAKETGKPVVVAGCVPQGDQNSSAWNDVSVIGVQQINRVVEVVEESLRGNKVKLFGRTRKDQPELDLPKVRRNRWIEIIPINSGCLNQCTYCKTKHARGDLKSWTVQEITDRVQQVVREGVKEIRITSEDTGAYGRDIGTDIGKLLKGIAQHIPDGVMLRVGMTNPPYILEHLNAIAEILNLPNVYSFLHIPVQSGSNRILNGMAREYTVEEFRVVVDTLRAKVPGISIATDIICGFPGETEEDFQETLKLCMDYKFPFLYISQFYARPGTKAASMKPVRSDIIKDRSRRLTQLFESYNDCFDSLVGTTQRVWITEVASDGYNLVGHTKCYAQVLVDPEQASLGTDVYVYITEASKWSVKGRVVSAPVAAPATPTLLSVSEQRAKAASDSKRSIIPQLFSRRVVAATIFSAVVALTLVKARRK